MFVFHVPARSIFILYSYAEFETILIDDSFVLVCPWGCVSWLNYSIKHERRIVSKIDSCVVVNDSLFWNSVIKQWAISAKLTFPLHCQPPSVASSRCRCNPSCRSWSTPTGSGASGNDQHWPHHHNFPRHSLLLHLLLYHHTDNDDPRLALPSCPPRWPHPAGAAAVHRFRCHRPGFAPEFADIRSPSRKSLGSIRPDWSGPSGRPVPRSSCTFYPGNRRAAERRPSSLGSMAMFYCTWGESFFARGQFTAPNFVYCWEHLSHQRFNSNSLEKRSFWIIILQWNFKGTIFLTNFRKNRSNETKWLSRPNKNKRKYWLCEISKNNTF